MVFFVQEEHVDALRAIQTECIRQDEQWGANRSHPWPLWFAIAAEEHGEVAKEVVEIEAALKRGDIDALEEHLTALWNEANQTAAVHVQMMEAVDRSLAKIKEMKGEKPYWPREEPSGE